MIRCAHPSGQLKLLSRYRSAELSVSNNETASSLTEQSEIMLERKRQLPEGRMKSVKKVGGVLLKYLNYLFPSVTTVAVFLATLAGWESDSHGV